MLDSLHTSHVLYKNHSKMGQLRNVRLHKTKIEGHESRVQFVRGTGESQHLGLFVFLLEVKAPSTVRFFVQCTKSFLNTFVHEGILKPLASILFLIHIYLHVSQREKH